MFFKIKRDEASFIDVGKLLKRTILINLSLASYAGQQSVTLAHFVSNQFYMYVLVP